MMCMTKVRLEFAKIYMYARSLLNEEMIVIIMKQAAILIVDDNPEIREIIQILLTGEGFQVHEAANGTQALSQLKENIFDLIILDIMMTGLNGYQTWKYARSQTSRSCS